MASPTRVCIEHFTGSFLLFSIMGALNYYYRLHTLGVNAFIFLVSGIMVYTLICIAFTNEVYDISWRSALLGGIFSLGFYIYLMSPPHIRVFGLYMSVMAFFHFSEFLSIAIIQPSKVSIDSFVINHSPQYTVAAITSWIEFFFEAYFFPGLKQWFFISYVGLTMCIAGEVLRKVAMFTAGGNFNHLVQSQKAKDHVLVTNGIYAYFRHPSYVGWFYWAIGTQVLLVNPICIPAYVMASWMFFNSRISIEEITLLNFFGEGYVDYQKRVGTGIPFVTGYQV